jgi:GNAT superfamily N-acetyltransferase
MMGVTSEIAIRRAAAQDTETVSSILQEAARWLEERAMPLWREQELSPARVEREVAEGLFVLASCDGQAVGTMMFQLADMDFWPEVPPGESCFVHRLAVRRRYAGGRVSSALLRWAVEETRRMGRRYLRLDCVKERAKLRAIYEGFGFLYHSDWRFGPYLCARYEYDVQRPGPRPVPQLFRESC